MSGSNNSHRFFGKTTAVLFAWMMLWLTGASPAHADTPVSGNVSSNTTWRLSDSPFLVSGEVAVLNNAVLSIEPGVEVLFDDGASLRVERGTLSAQGTSTAPIVFTSINDVGSTPGDWGPLRFQRDTHDASTVLSHVYVRYGQGIVVEGASPTFNYLHIEHNAGPAISQDLSSSPKGFGLEATDNTLNGILVPAGEIQTDVVWALRGIPYVLEQGVIHVGRPIFRLAPSQLQLVTGVTGALEVTIPDPAPVGGLVIDVVSSVPSIAAVPTTVIVEEGANSVQIEVQALAEGTSTISASAAGFGTVTSSIHVIEPPMLNISPAHTVISIEHGGTVEVSLSELAPAGGRAVALAVSAPGVIDVPETVIIPPGASSAVVEVVGLALGSITLTASSEDFLSATSTIVVRPVSLNPPATLLVAPGLTRNMPILLTDPAPAGGLTITLESADPAIVAVPATVQVEAGAMSVNVDVQGVAVGASEVTVSAPGYESGVSLVQVDSIAIQLQPAGTISIPQGLTATRSVRLSKPAPAGGVWIAVQTLAPTIASVTPANVFVPEAQTLATTTLTLKGEAVGTTQVKLTSPGLSEMSASVSVGQPVRLEFSRSSLVLGKGLQGYEYDLYLLRKSGTSNYAPNTAVTVTLTSADPSKVGVPATVTIPAGEYYAYFRLSGLELTGDPVAVSASAAGYIPTQSPVLTTVVSPQIVFSGLDSTRGIGSAADNFYLSWYVPGASSPEYQTAMTDQVFDLSVLNASPEGIVPGFWDRQGNPTSQVTIAAGQRRSYDSNNQQYTYVRPPVAAGTYKVAANLPGFGAWQSGTVTVTSPQIEFYRTPIVVGLGLKTYEYEQYIRLKANGQNAPTATALQVSLTSDDPEKVGVPSTVTVPAGEFETRFQISGLGLTDTPVTVNASAVGYIPTQTPMMVNVVLPQIRFPALDGTRGVGASADNFYMDWYVTGAIYPENQTAISNQVFDLAIVDPSPSDIVTGLLDRFGDPTTQVTIAAGERRSYDSNNQQYTYVGTPVAAGTYGIEASLPGIGSWRSGTVTVTSPQFEFTRTSVNVGYGLKTYEYEVSVRLRTNGTNSPTATDLVVNLTSDDPGKVGVPAAITIPAGQYEMRFAVSGLGLTAEPVAIRASASGYITSPEPLMVTVVMPQIAFSSLDGTRGVGSEADNFYLNWYVPGVTYPSYQTAIADQVFDLSIADASPAGTVPGFLDRFGNPTSQVTIAAGQSSSHASLSQQYTYVGVPAIPGTYKVKAELPSVGSWTSGVATVYTPELRFSASSVVVGRGMNTYTYEVYLRRTANGGSMNGATAVSVSLTCASTDVCSVPATVTIPAGQYQIPFFVTGTGLGATRVIPNATGYVGAQELDVTTVTPQVLLSGVPSSLAVGASTNFSVVLQTPGSSYPNNQLAAVPIPIDLTSAQPSVATVPSQATVATGSRTASATLIATGAGTTTVTASGTDLLPVTSGTITVQQP